MADKVFDIIDSDDTPKIELLSLEGVVKD